MSGPESAPSALSWPEDASPEEAARLADEIVTALKQPVRTAGPGQRRTYVVVPNPIPYTCAQATFLTSVADEVVARGGVRVLDLAGGGRAYAIDDEFLFRRLLLKRRPAA